MDPKLGGGRVIGEACHFIELCNTFTGQEVRDVYARRLTSDGMDDTFSATLTYPDGSIATIDYLACASDKLPKEYVEVSADGRTAICDNFRNTKFSGRRTLKSFNPSPFNIEEIANVSAVSFAILDSAASGASVPIDMLHWQLEDVTEADYSD
jgi:predicted dehydrogenase